ncbi:hypothetical protein ABL78_4521 [Leptomonas seymouri]|uniref:Uncharacterized protein n=1 Tax=Leptomonas seymouri TaxID=5684 RepID=A0A0N1I3E0_LEPSE|nr:hypothetical protein ABL78_4521 [Leptomonas seymouri]|eukprot:KPI86405.1 hypothetical protein ABL78_4521 [Leptomonas seymouri]
MSDSENRDLVEYASTNSSTAAVAPSKTSPILSNQSAAASNAKVAVATELPTAPLYVAAHTLSCSSGMPVAAKKASSVRRTPGVPTAMQVHRGQLSNHPNPTPVPSAKPGERSIPPRTSWTTRSSVVNSAMSSVARQRGSVAPDSSRPSVARTGREALPPDPTQSSVRRRRNVMQASPEANTPQSVERRSGSVQQVSEQARPESFTTRAMSKPLAVQPFQLLSVDRIVPELPRELERAIERYYMSQLHQLSVTDQERIVYAMVAPRDVKIVMTDLKQQLQRGAAAASAATVQPLRSVHATPARLRSNGVQAHPIPQNALRDGVMISSRRRLLPEYHDERHSSRQQSFTPEQRAVVERFRQHFTTEACAAFLSDALDVCLACRARCYQEQPRIAKEKGVVLPEDFLMPFYSRSVSALLYNMTGWTQPEAIKLSRLVVSIVHDWMPVVVALPSTPQESAKQPQVGAAARLPPLPKAPYSNAPEPVAAV